MIGWPPLHDALRFANRAEAGRMLAERLRRREYERPYVLGLPRGGVAVAYEVAKALEAPLDVVVARKLGAPGNEELGIGAVAPGVLHLNQELVAALGLEEREIAAIVARGRAELEPRIRLYRGDRPPPDLRGHVAVVVDDGLATGATARAAVETARRWGSERLVLAVPACAADSARALRGVCDEVVCVLELEELWAVGAYYRDFPQLSDEEVIGFLQRAWERQAAAIARKSGREEGVKTSERSIRE